MFNNDFPIAVIDLNSDCLDSNFPPWKIQAKSRQRETRKVQIENYCQQFIILFIFSEDSGAVIFAVVKL